jgi:hypothetical protein
MRTKRLMIEALACSSLQTAGLQIGVTEVVIVVVAVPVAIWIF